MLGAAGALCCLAAGTAAGSYLRDQRFARFRMLRAWCDALGAMRLLLLQERPALPELLRICAKRAAAPEVEKRLTLTAQRLADDPVASLAWAYEQACAQAPAPWEKPEERAALAVLFTQLGLGTAEMREQAAAACLRRLKPLMEAAEAEAQTGGKLCMQLGALMGLMAGIALW